MLWAGGCGAPGAVGGGRGWLRAGVRDAAPAGAGCWEAGGQRERGGPSGRKPGGLLSSREVGAPLVSSTTSFSAWAPRQQQPSRLFEISPHPPPGCSGPKEMRFPSPLPSPAPLGCSPGFGHSRSHPLGSTWLHTSGAERVVLVSLSGYFAERFLGVVVIFPTQTAAGTQGCFGEWGGCF